MLVNKRNPVIEEYPRHQIITKKNNKLQTLNPLTIFPSKKDTLTKAFFTVDLKQHKEQKQQKERWLDPNQITPQFGIQVGKKKKKSIIFLL